MNLTCATFAYPRLDSAGRTIVAERITGLDLPGVFVMSTCLRIEVVSTEGPEPLLAALTAGDLDGEFPKPEIYEEEAAILHLFRVAAGLESPVLGEKEILVQYRQAVADAQAGDQLDPDLVRILQSGVGAGRRARQVLPDQPHDSMGAIAADLVGGHERVTIIGAGDMASAVARNLRDRPSAPAVTVLARRPEHVAISGVEIWPMTRLDDAVTGATAIVSATTASSRLLSQDHLAELLQRRSEPLLLIDMALPPDFSPPADSPVTHYDIDDLALMAGVPASAVEAEELIAELAGAAYKRQRNHQVVGPLIGQMMDDADAIVAATVARFGPRLTHAGDEEILRQAVHTATRSILSRPIAHLREVGETEEANVVSDLFQPSYE